MVHKNAGRQANMRVGAHPHAYKHTHIHTHTYTHTHIHTHTHTHTQRQCMHKYTLILVTHIDTGVMTYTYISAGHTHVNAGHTDTHTHI